MLAEAQLQLQNAQHSVLFLQNEHAKTIKGLHEEIKNLQQRCGGELILGVMYNWVLLQLA